VLENDEQEISQIIESGLEEILSGRDSLEGVLSKYPALADTLRPELESALWLITKQEQVRARPGFVSASRKRLVNRIKQEASTGGAKRAFLGFNWPLRRPAFQWVAALLIFLVFFSASGGVVSAAQGSIPGEDLYQVKRFSEQVVYDLTQHDGRKIEISRHYADRRLMEVEALITRSDYALAQETLLDFERQINKTLVLLEQTQEVTPREKLVLAEALNDEMNRQTGRLEALMVNAPPAMQQPLASARDASVASALLARDLSEQIRDEQRFFTLTPSSTFTTTLTETLTKSLTQTLTSTLTETLTSDSKPTGTADDGTVDAAAPTVKPDHPAAPSTPTPVIVVVTPKTEATPVLQPTATAKGPNDHSTIKPGLTKTPRPTNENRPTEQEKTQEEKPPKIDK
jgi:hypothetical protein